MTQNLFDNIHIANKSYQELLDLFNINIQDDCDYYPIIAYHLLKNNEQNIIDNFENFNDVQKVAIIDAFGFFDNISNNAQDFLLSFLDSKNNNFTFSAILSLKNKENYYSDLIEKFLYSDDVMIKNSAIQYFAKKKGLLFKDELRKLLNDKNEFIREVALDELDDLDDEDLINDALYCLNDNSESVKDLANYIVNRLKQS
ncbi:Uncharacterised protein [Moraxella lacunata]|uniref:HEAT repeat domain-containing protein n=1 Tax=Moraxella lacunata TaxID=477 RepID=A0A378TVQ9_MORLA|nr:hypothetical protein [Moraxella lacunata]STZ63982.1 Uncharacterised protein [Moraxella lacunata]